MFLINVIFTLIFGLFVFKPSELKFKKIFIYAVTCLLLSPFIGAPFYYFCLKD